MNVSLILSIVSAVVAGVVSVLHITSPMSTILARLQAAEDLIVKLQGALPAPAPAAAPSFPAIPGFTSTATPKT